MRKMVSTVENVMRVSSGGRFLKRRVVIFLTATLDIKQIFQKKNGIVKYDMVTVKQNRSKSKKHYAVPQK